MSKGMLGYKAVHNILVVGTGLWSNMCRLPCYEFNQGTSLDASSAPHAHAHPHLFQYCFAYELGYATATASIRIANSYWDSFQLMLFCKMTLHKMMSFSIPTTLRLNGDLFSYRSLHLVEKAIFERGIFLLVEHPDPKLWKKTANNVSCIKCNSDENSTEMLTAVSLLTSAVIIIKCGSSMLVIHQYHRLTYSKLHITSLTLRNL